jgi:aminoglycoside phosphotransferase (APT) family kinase protein
MVAQKYTLDARFHRAIEHVVRRRCGEYARVASIDISAAAWATSYSCSIVHVATTCGDAFKLFLKDFTRSRFPKDEIGERRRRELAVYSRLLHAPGLGTAELYASAADEKNESYWLLLEFVEGVQLRYCDVRSWIAAAAWLPRLQATCARRLQDERITRQLARHDDGYFLSYARLAVASVYTAVPPLAEQLRSALRGYEALAAWMASQPSGLVHGSFRPINILVATHAGTERICPVDWELSAVGSTLYDLAFLVDGFEPPILDRFISAYTDSLREHAQRIYEPDEWYGLILAYQLHKILKSLSECRSRNFEVHVIEILAQRAEAKIAEVARFQPRRWRR